MEMPRVSFDKIRQVRCNNDSFNLGVVEQLISQADDILRGRALYPLIEIQNKDGLVSGTLQRKVYELFMYI